MNKSKIAVIVFIISLIMLSACADSSPTGQPDLEGGTWVLTAINKNRPVEGTQTTLKFESGQISGNAGCNLYGGSYQYEGDAITFGDMFSTEMDCMDPEGVMEQERTYQKLLGTAQRFGMVGGILTIFADLDQTITFQAYGSTDVETPITENFSPTPIPTFKPPAGFKEYQDSLIGVSVYIPGSWIVTGIIEGQYAIFQSYPEDKYVGGEILEPEDTKCDLNIRPPGDSAAELIQQWESDGFTTIISEREIVLYSGRPAIRIELDSMGRSNTVISEINTRVVVLTCFGNFDLFDEIAVTLRARE